MEMHQLRYVVAVARARNFSRAAEQCHVSQPSLSQQIQKLEEELGERLFDRMKREAKLTPHGEVFLPRAQCSTGNASSARAIWCWYLACSRELFKQIIANSKEL